MIFNSDWHIHSENSCDQACMRMQDLVSGTSEAGILDYGITDHIHTSYNYPDIIKSKTEYDRNASDGFHFGVEVSCVSKWEIDLIMSGAEGNFTYGIRDGGPAGAELAIGIDEEFIRKHGIEYVVGGTHWAMYTENKAAELIKDYHRQNMFLSQHSLVDIIAHPWWCYEPDEDGWYSDFSTIPMSFHEEFAESCIENNKLVEINLGAMLLSKIASEKFKQEYIEYLLLLKEYGVKFSFGSDCHYEFYKMDFKKGSDILESAGFKSNDFYNPVNQII